MKATAFLDPGCDVLLNSYTGLQTEVWANGLGIQFIGTWGPKAIRLSISGAVDTNEGASLPVPKNEVSCINGLRNQSIPVTIQEELKHK